MALTFLACVTSAALAEGTLPDHRLDEAKRFFRTAELADPRASIRDSAYSQAQRLAEQVIASDPSNADAHFIVFAARGRRLLHDCGKPSLTNFWKYSAINKHLSRALELDPRNANALAAKGGILLDLPAALGGDPEAGRQLLERAVEINPTGLGTRVTLARALLAHGDRDGARQHLVLAAHYACIKREAAPLMQAENLLAKLTSGSL
jgi:tetratricopeptide (TPR) repeat protein